ncbi:MAG: CoA transferase subunit A [SAR202 cluster bacterium]|nr:succinyl-CoA--3-ketoacid-CoA transferase [Chloroflexota bacterium]MQF94585.1 CoA transferase subunit A [SAR202 cluster bacterium]MQG33280.1 CoA transferase subunit A [SAR202 cluster bacterium]HAA94622.1 succinyl-CoA--3-ketoacid-CoA transferase [Dehalococcoidia bacterium]HCP22957.1 succinyl-CoA--3-ketoacid-CoA transferase [Dehalococcoidia bacterium]|tara:strand:- start:970 stop:1668 length:699 start_codon:yes stop_codon:yes gene_type:complete
MKNKIYKTMDDAVADIPDGVTILSPGFSGVGVPRNLLAALNRQGAKGLTGVSNNAGTIDENVDIGTLVEAGQMKKMICAFTASPHPSQVTPFTRMYNNDEIDAELVPQGTLAERLRCAAAGIGGFYTPTSVGTELAEGKEHREINGRVHVLEYPLPGDYGLIRAWKADTAGNLIFRLTQRNFNPLMAMAAKVTIVEVEEDIVEAGELDPDHIHVAGIYVDRLVKIPEDGIWI